MQEQMPSQEPLPSIEVQKPSPALVLRVIHGEFDPDKPVQITPESRSLTNAYKALGNQNRAIRKADEEKFAAKNQNPEKPLSPKNMRHNQMAFWSLHATSDLVDDLKAEGRKDKTAAILKEKLHLPLKGNLGEDIPAIVGSFYDVDSQTEGSFYKEFCGNNMNEALARELSIDDMMHLKQFLTKWMLGSDEAFTALVTLKHSMEMIKDPQGAAQLQALSGSEQLDPRDADILRFFREGLTMNPDEDEKKKSSVQQQAGATQEEPSQSSRIAETEKEELPPIRVGMSEDPNTAYRPTMEDAHVIERELGGNPDRGFYAIYDGHGGREVADVAAKSLHQNLITILDTKRLSPANALRAAYNLTDGSMQQANILGGATALTVLTEGNKIYVANLGDARAVLIHEGDTAERLSTDRKALDPQEQARVRERGGEIYTKRDEQGKIIDVRVVGKTLPDGNTEMLAVSAALGDFDYPGIQREPDIQEITRQASDKWLILACDGVWDVIHDADVAGIIGTEPDPQKASDLLVQAALERGSKDNVSVIALQLQP